MQWAADGYWSSPWTLLDTVAKCFYAEMQAVIDFASFFQLVQTCLNVLSISSNLPDSNKKTGFGLWTIIILKSVFILKHIIRLLRLFTELFLVHHIQRYIWTRWSNNLIHILHTYLTIPLCSTKTEKSSSKDRKKDRSRSRSRDRKSKHSSRSRSRSKSRSGSRSRRDRKRRSYSR